MQHQFLSQLSGQKKIPHLHKKKGISKWHDIKQHSYQVGLYGKDYQWAMVDTEIYTRDGKPFVHSTYANETLATAAATAKNSAVTTTGHADIKGLHP